MVLGATCQVCVGQHVGEVVRLVPKMLMIASEAVSKAYDCLARSAKAFQKGLSRPYWEKRILKIYHLKVLSGPTYCLILIKTIAFQWISRS